MKHTIFLMSFLFSVVVIHAQKEWHRATEPLKLPKSKGNIYSSIGWLKKYDSIPCTLVLMDSSSQSGYKMVHIEHGFYVDNKETLGVFFDTAFQRIYNVRKYRFD